MISVFRYSSDDKNKSGQINVYSNTAKETKWGWWNDKSTAFNYTINISGKFISGNQGGMGYVETAQIHDPETGMSSSPEYIGASNDRANPNGTRSRDMFAATKSAFGLNPPPTSIEAIYPESILVPIAPKGLGLLSKAEELTVKETGGLKQWVRIGESYSRAGRFRTYGIRWGAGGNYWRRIENTTLRNLNQEIRQMKLPFGGWRSADPGHFHFWKLD